MDPNKTVPENLPPTPYNQLPPPPDVDQLTSLKVDLSEAPKPGTLITAQTDVVPSETNQQANGQAASQPGSSSEAVGGEQSSLLETSLAKGSKFSFKAVLHALKLR